MAGHHWQHSDYMLADLVDGISQLVTDFRNANRAEKAAPQPYPEPAWRPESAKAKKKRQRKARREAAEARAGYQRIVALATPQHAEKG
ncbi:hypothetical protein ACSR0Z_28125 [Streptomyces viridosporus]